MAWLAGFVRSTTTVETVPTCEYPEAVPTVVVEKVVAPVPPAMPAPSFELVFDGVTVRVPAAFDAAALRAVLGVLGRPC